MRHTGNTDLRKLVHDYYNGELSYASYRRARTQLLDRITGKSDGAECTRSTIRPVNRPGMAGQSAGQKPWRSRLLRSILLLLLVSLFAIMLLVWAMNSNSSLLSSG
jgi:hypothetical protein